MVWWLRNFRFSVSIVISIRNRRNDENYLHDSQDHQAFQGQGKLDGQVQDQDQVKE